MSSDILKTCLSNNRLHTQIFGSQPIIAMTLTLPAFQVDDAVCDVKVEMHL